MAHEVRRKIRESLVDLGESVKIYVSAIIHLNVTLAALIYIPAWVAKLG